MKLRPLLNDHEVLYVKHFTNEVGDIVFNLVNDIEVISSERILCRERGSCVQTIMTDDKVYVHIDLYLAIMNNFIPSIECHEINISSLDLQLFLDVSDYQRDQNGTITQEPRIWLTETLFINKIK